MKTPAQIQAEIEAARKFLPFHTHPKTIECRSEYEVMWRADNGRSYNHIIERADYQYHLIYFDDRLAIVEKTGVTIFSHLVPELEKMMQGDVAAASPVIRDNRKIRYHQLPASIQQQVKLKHESFPDEIRPLLEYRLDGNLVLSSAALSALARQTPAPPKYHDSSIAQES